MPEAIHFYEPRHGHGLPHDPFNAIVGPRPIGWISTRSADGVRNIAQTGEFVWNLVTRPLAEAMNQTCVAVPPEVSEFELADHVLRGGGPADYFSVGPEQLFRMFRPRG